MAADKYALEAISSREVGQIPVSIGSSLALEGAFGILEDNPNPKPIIQNVDVVYINMRTLIRNIVGAISGDLLSHVFPEDIAQCLLNELTIIESAVIAVTNGRVSIVPYICNYRSIPKKFPFAILKAAKTDLQQANVMREENALIEFKEMAELQGFNNFIETDIDLPKDNRRVLLMSSYAIDLLQRYNFGSVTLLESHTGATKPPALWNTKLTNGRDLPNIPFDRMTIQFFGDGSNLFTGYPIKVRRVLLSIAEKNKWNVMTTKDYILSTVKKAHEPELESLLIKLYAKV